MLIPRMKNWVATNYPGTKIGVTEYNWGAETNINGAIAQADLLGIFGREGLDLATRWTTPANTAPTYNAMKLYRNYDGNKSTFGDTSVQATVPNPDNLSAFGAVRTSDGAMTLMVINKDLNNATPIMVSLANFNAAGTAQRWQLTSANTINHLANMTLTTGTLSDLLPAVRVVGDEHLQSANWQQPSVRTVGFLAQRPGWTILHPPIVHRSGPLVSRQHQPVGEQFI